MKNGSSKIFKRIGYEILSTDDTENIWREHENRFMKARLFRQTANFLRWFHKKEIGATERLLRNGSELYSTVFFF